MTSFRDIRERIRSAPETGASAPVPPVPPTPPKPEKGLTGGFSGLRVSLMPVDESENRPDLRRRVFILVIALIIETLIIGGTYVFLDLRARSQQAELAQLRQQQQKLSADIERQEASADELAAFSTQIRAISERLDKHVHWTNVLTLLEQYTKPSVRYENFAGGLSGHLVTLSASAPSYRDMAEQILVFRAMPMIRNVRAEAGISDLDEQGRLSGVKWNMVLDLAPEVWMLEAKDKVKNADVANVVPAPIPAPAGDSSL